jgi:hypothetical protein
MAIPAEIQSLLDKLEPEVAKAFREAIDRISSSAQLAAVIGALERNDINAVLIALRLDATFFDPMDRMIAQAFWTGGVNALMRLPSIPDPFPAGASCSASMAETPAPNNGRDNTPGT